MTHHDLTHWPLVITMERGPASLDDTRALFEAWNGWLARGEPFAILRIFTDSELPLPAPGAAQLFKPWLQQQGAAIRQQVIGMATVVPDSALERVRKMNAEKLFGVPAASFAEIPAALDWLRETAFAAKGWTLDTVAIGSAVDGLLVQAV